MHGSNRLGGNSLSDLLVFGRRAGLAAAEYAKRLDRAPAVDQALVEGLAREMLAPLERPTGESPYAIQEALQEVMEANAGIVRTEDELRKGLEAVEEFKQRLRQVKAVGTRQYNPGWHTALDLWSLLTVAEAIIRGALERKESRGGHTRLDYPKADPRFGKVNIVIRKVGDRMTVVQEPLPEMPPELRGLFEGDK